MSNSTDIQIIKGEEDQRLSSDHELSDVRPSADKIINRYALIAAGLGVVPSPTINSVAVLTLELQMIDELSVVYQAPFPTRLALIKAFASLVGSLGPVYFAFKARTALGTVPVFGQLLSASIYSITGGISVYAIGKIFQRHFESGGEFLSKDNWFLRKFFKEKYEEGKQMIPQLTST